MRISLLYRIGKWVAGALVVAALATSCGSNVRFAAVKPSVPSSSGGGIAAAPSKVTYSPESHLEEAAAEWLGTPYKYGGTNKSGVDCSAFVMNVFHSTGVNLPRTVRQQWQIGEKVSPEDARTGDLVFFTIRGREVSHVGIYLRDDMFIHASLSSGVVIESLRQSYYQRHFTGIRRVPELRL